jgi:hypothetical protein
MLAATKLAGKLANSFYNAALHQLRMKTGLRHTRQEQRTHRASRQASNQLALSCAPVDWLVVHYAREKS